MKALEKLIKDDTDLNKQYDKNTPLGLAAARNDKTMVKFLVEKGADINLEDGYGYTPLTYLVSKAVFGTDVCYYLIKNGADVNKKNNNGYTPLILAVQCTNYGILGVLVNMGADYNIKNNEGKTAMDIVIENDDKSALHNLNNPSNLEYYLKIYNYVKQHIIFNF